MTHRYTSEGRTVGLLSEITPKIESAETDEAGSQRRRRKLSVDKNDKKPKVEEIEVVILRMRRLRSC